VTAGSPFSAESTKLRVANSDALDQIISSWTSQHAKDEIESLLTVHDVPCSAVRTISDVLKDEDLFLRGTLRWVNHDGLGPLAVAGSPMRFAEPAAELRPAPALGQDNPQVYGHWLGLHADEIARLERDGVIAPMPSQP
jgi:crotonobetainyl-CoA:carnitine CoA-transferase CaiB-like acyl-CoA transferase